MHKPSLRILSYVTEYEEIWLSVTFLSVIYCTTPSPLLVHTIFWLII